jgi:hypothetical protein
LNSALPTPQQNQIATQLGLLVQENHMARATAQLQRDVDKNKLL